LGVGLKVYFDTLEVSTSKKVELVNITRQVEEVVGKSNVKDGICLVFAPHATAAVIVNEDEKGLKEDIVKWLEENFPPRPEVEAQLG
jgi:secondary thiamine-phosphate synthase enzyme